MTYLVKDNDERGEKADDRDNKHQKWKLPVEEEDVFKTLLLLGSERVAVVDGKNYATRGGSQHARSRYSLHSSIQRCASCVTDTISPSSQHDPNGLCLQIG
jgi:hypothetical protein